MQTQAKKVGRKFRDGDHRRIVQRHAVVCLASFAVSHEDDSRSPALQSKRASKNNTTCIISVGCIISGTRQSRWDTAAHTSATRRHPGGTPAATRRQQRRRAVDALRERRRSAQNGASSAGTRIVSQAKAAARAGPVAASPRVRAAASNRHCWGPTPLASGESSAHLRPQHAAAPGAWPRAATWDRIEVGILSPIKDETSFRSFCRIAAPPSLSRVYATIVGEPERTRCEHVEASKLLPEVDTADVEGEGGFMRPLLQPSPEALVEMCEESLPGGEIQHGEGAAKHQEVLAERSDLFAPEYVWREVDAASHTGFDVRTYFGFCTLLMGKKDIRPQLNMPDMLLLSDGIILNWLFTAKRGPMVGKVLRKHARDLVPEVLRNAWVAKSRGNHYNFERHVAVLTDGRSMPRILSEKAFEHLVSLMRQEKGMGNKVLQVAVQPLRNQVYRATYSKKGETMVKDVIMLRHSHVFRPAGHTVNVIYPTRRMRAVGERSQNGPEEILPAVPEHIMNECIRCLHALMLFMSKAWQLDLDEVVCDFMQDHNHTLWLVRIVRCALNP